ncbi:MAG TPA: polyprenyl synthetase family protein [Candidatus Nanopelagicales bacterium]|jgi:geranylgeranyl diphosphate synthase type I|nr:polyprenyl synthetase family protein [Candidatus Nanopelagicales bacterium]
MQQVTADADAPGSPLDAEGLRTRVQTCLDDFLDGQAPLLAGIGDELAPVMGTLTDLLAGGKRLRAAFAYWGWRGAGGGDDDEAMVRAATALELLQACALIHDDVMDGSETRRGLPAAHRRFAALHRAGGWTGSAEVFGTGAAILLGDLALSWADQLLFASGLPDDALLRAKPTYDLMRTELMAGQYLDLLEQARGGGSLPRAMRVVRYKAAKYTIERPLHLGGALAGADTDLQAAYTGYGLPLGEAFQLRDDLLGVFGDPERTGKPAGDDLREGKRTVLVATALANASPAGADLLHRHLGDPGLDDAGVAAVRAVITETGAVERTEELIETLTGQALAVLPTASLPAAARQALTRLAHAATARTV